jgi:malate dehydrogenase (oxaloacetate-decarboxylating)
MAGHLTPAPVIPDVLSDPVRNRGTAAITVARAAAADGVATRKPDNMVQAVHDAMWRPVYLEGEPG